MELYTYCTDCVFQVAELLIWKRNVLLLRAVFPDIFNSIV